MNKIAGLVLIGSLALYGCGQGDMKTSDQIQNRQQEEMSKQAVLSVGPPAIVNFQEKRTLKMIYELRDTTLSTTTYIVDRYGKTHKVCDSVGYGIPYATQYTSPQRVAKWNETPGKSSVVLPQADPNGLFSPADAEGTWVLCLDNKNKKVLPIYIEPRIIVSPFPLDIK